MGLSSGLYYEGFSYLPAPGTLYRQAPWKS